MDNSQSSNVFSDSEDLPHGDRNAVTIICGMYLLTKPVVDVSDEYIKMDQESYESTITNTKVLLSKNLQNEITKSTFSTYFEAVLENCNTCIFQSLDLIIGLLDDPDSQLSNLQHYMENTVCLLQMLSGFIKNVIESVSMPCCTMKTFPTTTGRIIMAVFTHCKDSESIYGHNLKGVENQLKDLFRTCHELQITYLMVLEKHFIFDLSEKDELDILVEALDINLKIGEIVQSLDVKTMAEQWKAYTMICDKHSNNLKDTHIYYNCTKILCAMIESNIKTAVEIEQDEKIILRSLKVANFTIKILLKVCNIFKLAMEKNYKHVIDLLLYVYLNNCAYLELTADKSTQFANLMNVHVANPADSLLKELLLDEHFCNCVLKLDMDSLKDDELLGYILLLISVIKSVLQNDNDGKILKKKLMESIFRFLPYGHIWFNMGLKFKTEAKAGRQTYGLYEHLLAHTLALSSTLNAQEFVTLEQKMFEALLSTDCYKAMFSSNLWILMVRYSHLHNRQFALVQLVSLCKVYQKLETNKLFHKSPQQVHLTYTMSRCFETLHDEDKSRVYKQFSIKDQINSGLWTALKVRNLPAKSQYEAEESIMEVLNEKFRKLFAATSFKSCEEIDDLISTIKLASTCQFDNDVHSVEEFVVTAWTKACPINNKFILSKGDLDRGAVWYLEYVQSVVLLTDSMKYLFQRSANLVKILHVVSPMIQKGNSELKLVLMNLLCKIALSLVQDDNRHLTESLLEQSFKHLLQETNQAVRSQFFNVLRKNRPNKNIDNIIAKVISEDNTLRETWNHFIEQGKLRNLNINLKERLKSTLEFKYCHKCVESKHVIELSDGSLNNKSNSNNFDLVDIDSLFDNESDSEPACKKVKLNTNEAVEIIARLENDAALLSNVKENVFDFDDKVRIRNVCEKLLNIID